MIYKDVSEERSFGGVADEAKGCRKAVRVVLISNQKLLNRVAAHHRAVNGFGYRRIRTGGEGAYKRVEPITGFQRQRNRNFLARHERILVESSGSR